MQQGKKTILYVGRFQPLHLGHEFIIRSLIKDGHKVVIGIGGANESRLFRNPFTVEEREKMLKIALSDVWHKIKVVRLFDKHKNPQWLEHVLAQTKGLHVTHFVTGNDYVNEAIADGYDKLLRERLKGPRLQEHEYPGVKDNERLKEHVNPGDKKSEKIHAAKDLDKLQATNVRKYLADGDYDSLEGLLNPRLIKYLRRIDAAALMRAIKNAHPHKLHE